MPKINVAIAGVGSLTKALVEGVSYYSKNTSDEVGLIHPSIGPYQVRDINFACAFDVDKRKIGQQLHNAIGLGANITREITSPLPCDAVVYRGPTLDGLIDEVRGNLVHESSEKPVDVSEVLKNHNVDVLINLIPSGSDEATRFYANEALKANCSFVNCIPSPLATTLEWREKFESKGLVLLGDDAKSQLGATMLNRFLLQLLKMRGIKVTRTHQENRGGNADHFNLRYRSEHKEKSKSAALSQYLAEDDAKPTVSFIYTDEPSGHKQVTLTIEGEIFGRTPISITSVIEDEISVNGAGTIVDAIRIAKYLVDTSRQNQAKDACPFLMKTPSVCMTDEEASRMFDQLLVE